MAGSSQPRSAAAARLIAQRARFEKRLTIREKLFLIMDEPTSSVLARVVALSVLLVTVASTISAVLETCRDPSLLGGLLVSFEQVFSLISTFAGVFFTSEAVLRVSCYVPFRRVVLDPFIWLDCLTPLPFLLNMLFGFKLPILTAWGSIRLLKLCRYFESSALLYKAFLRSIDQLLVPLFMLTTMVVVCSSVLFYIEFDEAVDSCVQAWHVQGVPMEFTAANPGGVGWTCDEACAGGGAGGGGLSEGDPLHDPLKCATCLGYPDGHPECSGVAWAQVFLTIPHTMWFLIVTVSTVGFGDVSPSTVLGQAFISVVIMFGIIFLAMPLSVVGNNFQHVWDERQLFKLQGLTRQMLSENDMSPEDCMSAFKEFDQDGDGLIDESEFGKFVVGILGLALKKQELQKLWAMLDTNMSGSVNYTEFAAMLFPDHDFGDSLAAGEGDSFIIKKGVEVDKNIALARDGVHGLGSASEQEADCCNGRASSTLGVSSENSCRKGSCCKAKPEGAPAMDPDAERLAERTAKRVVDKLHLSLAAQLRSIEAAQARADARLGSLARSIARIESAMGEVNLSGLRSRRQRGSQDKVNPPAREANGEQRERRRSPSSSPERRTSGGWDSSSSNLNRPRRDTGGGRRSSKPRAREHSKEHPGRQRHARGGSSTTSSPAMSPMMSPRIVMPPPSVKNGRDLARGAAVRGSTLGLAA